jgi:hypothetical protein
MLRREHECSEISAFGLSFCVLLLFEQELR